MGTLKLSGFEVIVTLLLLAFGLKVAFAAGPDFPPPSRTVAVISSQDGFYPALITARQGEQLKIVLTAVDRPGCLLTNDGRLNLAVVPGKLAMGEIKLEQVEEISFHCPTGALQGKILVRPNLPPKSFLNQKRNFRPRKIASETEGVFSREDTWRPRDE